MGYTTEFTGSVSVDPPLNGPEMDYLRKFADKDHRISNHEPYPGMPGYHCDWVPTSDGLGIEWNGMEKFYDAEKWMKYLIDTFLRDGAILSALPDDPSFRYFTRDHVVNGRIEAQGEDPDDRWTLVVVDNVVSKVKYPTLAERMSTDVSLAAAFETLKAAGVTVEQFAKATGQDY